MRIAYGSDIHLEFGYFEPVNKHNADVLVLAGDISVIQHWDFCENFFQKCREEFEHTIYIMGNHEHYFGDVSNTFNKIKINLEHIKNIHPLENKSLVIKDYKFICSTLWTDCNNDDVMTKIALQQGMNDYELVRNKTTNMTPEHTVAFHKKALRYLRRELESDHKHIIVTHHAPSQKSISEKYSDDFQMNGGYRSELDDFVQQSKALAWIHGHTHHNVDYMIGDTRVVSNQRGYIGHEELANGFELKIIDV